MKIWIGAGLAVIILIIGGFAVESSTSGGMTGVEVGIIISVTLALFGGVYITFNRNRKR